MKKQLQWQEVLSLLLILCLFAIVTPKFNQSPKFNSPVTLSRNYYDLVLPSTHPRTIDDLTRNCHGDFEREILAIDKTGAILFASSQTSHSRCYNTILTFHHNFPNEGFQQACQLSDLPPPSFAL